jgi:hypothetical protein
MGARIVDLTTAAGTAHSNSTTEASLASHSFSAGSLTPGKVYLIRGGARATATNGSDTATMRIRWGTSDTVASNTEVGVGAAVDVADNDVSTFTADLICQTATRAVLTGVLFDCDATNTADAGQHFASILTIDQATAYRFDFTCDWSAASSSNSIQAEGFVVVEIV